MCSGFVQAFQTRSRGASMTRVITTSRSDGVVYAVTPTLAAVTMLLLRFLEVLEIAIEPLKARLPEAAVVLRPVGDLLEGGRLEPARPELRFAAARDQARALQDPQMLGDRGAAHGERRRQLLHGGGAGGEPREDGAPSGIGECGEDGAQLIGGHYITCWLSNLTVIYNAGAALSR